MIAEEKYTKKVDIAHRKKYAQFFTPPAVADLMTDWILGNKSAKTLLEPAFGLGIFSRFFIAKKTDLAITGFDIDPLIFQEANQSFQNQENINLKLADYLYNDWGNKYDGIICNPPYFKFHDYENKEALTEIRSKLDINLNGFTNIYSLFLLKSIYQLDKNGRAAYIIPSEFLNSDYGKFVKDYLIKSKTLKHILIFDFKENVFDDALTTSAILLLSKEKNNHTVNFISIKSEIDFLNIKNSMKKSSFINQGKTITYEQIDSQIKWRSYYQPQLSLKYQPLIPFNKVAKVVRGIATGCNEYFVFNQEKANNFKISADNLLPCITRSKDVKTPFFSKKDYEQLKENNANAFLFNAGKNPEQETVLKYIKIGESQGVHHKFLTSRRKPWFILENRPPAPIWVSVFNRNKVRFIRNEAAIHNLTTFHCVYLKLNLFQNINIDLLFAYLQTNLAAEIFSDNRREYGNGLKKFEPNDLNNGKILDLSILSQNEEKSILQLFKKYKLAVNNQTNPETYLLKIETIFKAKYLRNVNKINADS